MKLFVNYDQNYLGNSEESQYMLVFYPFDHDFQGKIINSDDLWNDKDHEVIYNRSTSL